MKAIDSQVNYMLMKLVISPSMSIPETKYKNKKNIKYLYIRYRQIFMWKEQFSKAIPNNDQCSPLYKTN